MDVYVLEGVNVLEPYAAGSEVLLVDVIFGSDYRPSIRFIVPPENMRE